MPFGLTIGTDRAIALQNSIQDELTKRGYSPDADPVMAEYITIMIINNKTPAQITIELEDLIGTDFDRSFTDWLFTEAAKGASDSETSSHPQPSTSDPSPELTTTHDIPSHISPDSPRRTPAAPRGIAPLYQQALSQTFPNTSPPTHKRTASARSPSPGHPNKSRRTDLPTGPRAMLRDGNPNSRSLLERVGGPAGQMRNGNASNRFQRDDIQARIDSITANSPDMMAGAFPQMNGGMDMNAMGMPGMANPMMFQEMMMNQMALMAQMASSMGMINNAAPVQYPAFPMQGVMPGEMGMFPGGGMNGFPGPQHQQIGGANGGRSGRGRGRGGPPVSAPKVTEEPVSSAHESTGTLPAPTPIVPASPSSLSTPGATANQQPQAALVGPDRPQSPTLCKFGLKCTNAHCRYSHPSPVATAESGVVLSNEACENGIACKDKDCIKAHVSPAVLNAPAEPPASVFVPPVVASTHSPAVCRFGSACTRPTCPFLHPTPRLFEQKNDHHNHFAQQCRFGAACTRAACPFQHPEGRVLPTTFHRGLSTTAPMVTVPTPEAGSMGGPSPHKSVTFNQGKRVGEGIKAQLEKQMKEIEEKKNEAEKAVKEAEAAANKKDESTVVAIAA